MMIRLYPEQLRAQLTEGLRAAYLLLGNDPLLLQESQDAIREAAAAQGFTEHHTFSIDNSTDWQAIFALSQAMSLFASRQTLLLILPENGPNAAINEQLATLVGLLHDDLLLIVRGNKLTKAQENAAWLTALAQRAVQVSCQTPEYAQLPCWLAARAKQHQLQLDDAASQLLCYCYEGNLLALAQALERLALLWPDGKLTLPRVEQAVNDAAHFTPYHWVDALLAGKSKRVLHVLQQLRLEGCEPAILLRTLQRELLLLVTLKRQATHTPLRSLFDKHRVWQNRRQLLSDALTRLSGEQLRQAVTLLTRAELTFKQDYGHDVWPELESLSLLLCHKALADVFVDMTQLQAIYGGTFDPVHYGHLKPVEILANQIGLSKVIIMPNNVPPHRPQPEATSAQRVHMLKLAIADKPLFTLDERELRRDTPSWTAQTLQEWRQEQGPRKPLAFIIGQDSLLTFPTWHNYETILDNAHLIVCRRPGYPLTMAQEADQRWLDRHLTHDVESLHNRPSGVIYLAETPWFDISATIIRQRLERGESCAEMLPAAVLDYIREQGLYC